MTVLKRIFLVTILIICISFSFCYAIDENQLSQNSNQPSVTTGNSQTQVEENDQSVGTNSQVVGNDQSVDSGTQADDTNITTNDNTSVQETTNSLSTSNQESQSSTTVSNVSSNAKTSTVTNILNIALLVVGVLLIFLAIAILIRLNS